MPYDLFISYSRRDNHQGRITQLVDRIQADFATFAGRPLVPFFDATEIHGMDDWRHRILQGLRESHLLLACLSPSYLESEYCEWEFNEYLKHEIGRAYFGDGVAPIYFVEVPGWEDKGFEQQCAAWVAELRRRQHFDLRPWFNAGEESLRDAAVQARMCQLNAQLKARINRGERAEHSLGNVDAHNPHFIGRTTELRRLRETVALGKVGVLTAVHGLGGVGKTALAIEYAHAFAHEYGGGRWQVRCEGKENLGAAIAELAPSLALEFNEHENKDTDRRSQRVLAELRRLANAHEPHHCLLLLDNVDKPQMLEPAQTQGLPAAEWLHVVATTRLGQSDLHGNQGDRVFLPVDELPEADALELIGTYQPGGVFSSEAELEAAREMVNLLGGFTLAVETAAVHLGRFADEVTCAGFLARLKKEGLTGLETATEQTSEGVRHGEKRLTATLAPTLERLTEPEKLALSYAALLRADHVVLPWIRALVVGRFPWLGLDAQPGYPDPWLGIVRRLLSLRFLAPCDSSTLSGQLLITRVHRLVQAAVLDTFGSPANAVQASLAAKQNVGQGTLEWAALHLALGDPYLGLEALARLVLLARDGTLLKAAEHRLELFRSPIDLFGLDWALEFLAIALRLRFGESGEQNNRSQNAKSLNLQGEVLPLLRALVVIITGNFVNAVSKTLSTDVRELLHEAVAGVAANLVGSGVREGLGEVVGDLGSESTGCIRCFGYMPRLIHKCLTTDRRYNVLRFTPGDIFSPSEDLLCWADLFSSGVSPTCVKVLAFGGGPLTRVTCCIGLAMGAHVGVVRGTGRAADALATSVDWENAVGLIRLPFASEAIRKFVLNGYGEYSGTETIRTRG